MWFKSEGVGWQVERIRFKPVLLMWSVLIAVALLTSSCSTVDATKPAQGGKNKLAAANSQAAVDLLSIFKQITIPFSTTIQVSTLDDNDVATAAVRQLVQAGYGIQRVGTDQGANILSAKRTQLPDQNSVYKYTISVGNIMISRLYDLSANGVIPASAFEVSGSLVVAEIDDSHINSGYPDQFKTITYTNFESSDQQPTAISLFSESDDTGFTSSYGKNSSQLEISNLFNGTSVFQSVTDTHDRMARQVLVFANDSMVMGDTNKFLVRKFLARYETSRDQIRLIGCSNGQTALDIGNEGLALGRAARVTEELTRLGVPRDKVLDEGCWAPVSAGDRFPGRGVVIELWRGKR